MYPRGIVRICCIVISFVALFAGAALNTARAEVVGYGGIFRADTGFSTMIEANGDWMNIHAVVPTSDNGFLVGGDFTTIGGQRHLGVAKYKADGTVDPTFLINGGFDGPVENIAVQADGRILVSGMFSSFNGTNREGLARLNADGSLDTSFVVAPVRGRFDKIVVQADGRILLTRRFGADLNAGSASTDPVALDRGIVRLNANGTVDTTFTPPNLATGSSDINCLAVQADGRILVGGIFTTNAGVWYSYLQRLNTDGTLDSSFVASAGLNAAVKSIAVKANGKIVVCGDFIANATTFDVVCLNADGSVDTAFAPVKCAFDPSALVVQSDGKVVVGGKLHNTGPATIANTVRLNVDGSTDATYQPALVSFDAASVALQTDGRIVLAGHFNYVSGATVASIVRLTTSGAQDTLVTSNSRCIPTRVVAVPLRSGKFLAAGTFNWVNNMARDGIVRLNADGSVDSAFNPGTGFNAHVFCLAAQADGNVVVGGAFTSFNGTARVGLARLNSDGSLDTAFVPGFFFDRYVNVVVVQADGKILAAGGSTNRQIVRLNVDGTLDATFATDNLLSAVSIRSVAVQADGKIIIGGDLSVNSNNVLVGQGIARLNANGTTDLGYQVIADSPVEGLVLQPDRKAMASGFFTHINGSIVYYLARLNSDGTRDTTFAPGSVIEGALGIAPALQTDGRMVVCRIYPAPYSIVRLESYGERDYHFELYNYNGYACSICFTDEHRLLVAGGMAFSGGVKQVGLALLKPDPESVFPKPPPQPGPIRGAAPSVWYVFAVLALLVGGRKRFVCS